jgi:hypothetical protein
LTGTVTVEFLGMPRQRAGQPELVVPAGSVSDVLRTVQRQCPGLADLIAESGQLAAHYLVSIDGSGFVNDPGDLLEPGRRILLLSADAGG